MSGKRYRHPVVTHSVSGRIAHQLHARPEEAPDRLEDSTDGSAEDARVFWEYPIEAQKYIGTLLTEIIEVSGLSAETYEDAMYLQFLSEVELHREVNKRYMDMEEYVQCCVEEEAADFPIPDLDLNSLE